MNSEVGMNYLNNDHKKQYLIGGLLEKFAIYVIEKDLKSQIHNEHFHSSSAKTFFVCW